MIKKNLSIIFFVIIMLSVNAKEPEFKSELFKKGTLIYSDDFDKDYNKKRWGKGKDRYVKDGKLIISAKFKTAEEAKRVLKRDHHLGLAPTVSLFKIPEKFVCHLRYKFEAEKLTPNRPVLQIGHHMICLSYVEGGGHKIKLPKGPSYKEKSSMKINEWVDLVIEYQKGKILISVNGNSKVYEHKLVSIINKKDKYGHRFSFKHDIPGPKSRIVFDSVRLWEIKE